jgi:ABC-type nitrate/sulfonate/bicarbonate transport system permease component
MGEVLGIRTSFAADTPKPTDSRKAADIPSDNTSFVFTFRIYAQIILVGLVLAVLCVLAIMSAKFAFSIVAVADAEALAQQLENKKFAQDMVKTLVGFFAGMVTGILVGK